MVTSLGHEDQGVVKRATTRAIGNDESHTVKFALGEQTVSVRFQIEKDRLSRAPRVGEYIATDLPHHQRGSARQQADTFPAGRLDGSRRTCNTSYGFPSCLAA